MHFPSWELLLLQMMEESRNQNQNQHNQNHWLKNLDIIISLPTYYFHGCVASSIQCFDLEVDLLA